MHRSTFSVSTIKAGLASNPQTNEGMNLGIGGVNLLEPVSGC